MAFKWSAGVIAGAMMLGSPVLADDVSEGYLVYNENCATCHGKDMTNPGLAFDLRKFPADDPERFRTAVAKGKGAGMPPWEGKLSDEDIRLLWEYVKGGG